MKKLSMSSLAARRVIIIADLLSKAEAEDWHGVADAAMDLRELDAQLEVLNAAEYLAFKRIEP
jgi:hypothetical protein